MYSFGFHYLKSTKQAAGALLHDLDSSQAQSADSAFLKVSRCSEHNIDRLSVGVP